MFRTLSPLTMDPSDCTCSFTVEGSLQLKCSEALSHRAELPWLVAEDLTFALFISSASPASPRQSIDFPYRNA